MAIAVCAWFDLECENNIRSIWKSLDSEGINSTLNQGNCRPHLTLSVTENLQIDSFAEALSNKLTLTAPLSFSFSNCGIFQNTPPVAFLEVKPNAELKSLQALVHSLILKFGKPPNSYHLPEEWRPHCTIALSVFHSKFPLLYDFMRKIPLPIKGMIERIGIIETPIEKELKKICLKNI